MEDFSGKIPDDLFEYAMSMGTEEFSVSQQGVDELTEKVKELRNLAEKYGVPVIVALITEIKDEDEADLLGLVYGRPSQMPPSVWAMMEMVSRDEDSPPLHLQLLAMAIIVAMRETKDREIGEALFSLLRPILTSFTTAEEEFRKYVEDHGVIEHGKSIMELFNEAFKEEIEKGWEDDPESDQDGN